MTSALTARADKIVPVSFDNVRLPTPATHPQQLKVASICDRLFENGSIPDQDVSQLGREQ